MNNITTNGKPEPQSGATKRAVDETHWAKSDAERFERFLSSMPDIRETELALWQHRVNRSAIGIDTEYVPHTRLYVVRAQEYARTQDSNGRNISSPTGLNYSFLIAAESRNEAREKACKQLFAHGYNANNWAVGAGESHLILA